jgi:hypothetical protein
VGVLLLLAAVLVWLRFLTLLSTGSTVRVSGNKNRRRVTSLKRVEVSLVSFSGCGYASFIHCKASYDTPRRGIDHSFIVSYMTVMSNVKYPREISHKQAVTIKNGHAVKDSLQW